MSLRIALLGLLASRSASGYDLTKSFEISINHVWRAGHSQIYPELAKMTADELITVEAEGPRGRKIYGITPAGHSELRRWLAEHDPHAPGRSEWALHAFLLSVLEPAEALVVVHRMKVTFDAKLSELEIRERECLNKENQDFFGKYALDLGLRQARMILQWADDTIEELESKRTG